MNKLINLLESGDTSENTIKEAIELIKTQNRSLKFNAEVIRQMSEEIKELHHTIDDSSTVSVDVLEYMERFYD